MNTKFKLVAYVVLLCLVAWFGRGFYADYSTVTREAAEAATNDNTVPVVTNNPVATTNGSNPPVPASTNTAGTNDIQTSNVVAVTTNQEATAPVPPARTNVAVAPTVSAPPAHGVHGEMMSYLGALLLSFIALGLLVAYDFTRYIGSAVTSAVLDDKGEGQRDPEYERAEQAWANSKYLDAIQMMRDFLKKHPREQYAALRIAEIYEKDLNNPLAAALEYEEVLKKKLPAERWGWAAVHLCNLYSKLGQQDKGMALLQRIADDYPQTAAAKKARNRLGLPEPESEPEPAAEPEQSIEITAPIASMTPHKKIQTAPEPLPPPKSSLPPGFRPKK